MTKDQKQSLFNYFSENHDVLLLGGDFNEIENILSAHVVGYARLHNLKCWPEQFQAVKCRRKLFEVRKNDRNYQVGDWLHLQEYNPETETYTGNTCEFLIAHILEGGQFGIEKGYVVMSLL